MPSEIDKRKDYSERRGRCWRARSMERWSNSVLVAVGQTREVKLTGHDAAQGEQQSSRAPQPIHVSVVERGMFSSGKR